MVHDYAAAGYRPPYRAISGGARPGYIESKVNLPENYQGYMINKPNMNNMCNWEHASSGHNMGDIGYGRQMFPNPTKSRYGWDPNRIGYPGNEEEMNQASNMTNFMWQPRHLIPQNGANLRNTSCDYRVSPFGRQPNNYWGSQPWVGAKPLDHEAIYPNIHNGRIGETDWRVEYSPINDCRPLAPQPVANEKGFINGMPEADQRYKPNAMSPMLPIRYIGDIRVYEMEQGPFLGYAGPLRLYLKGKQLKHQWHCLALSEFHVMKEKIEAEIGLPLEYPVVAWHENLVLSEPVASLRYLAKRQGQYGMDHGEDLLMDSIVDRKISWLAAPASSRDTSIYGKG